VLSIVYVSTATSEFSEGQLWELLALSKWNNSRRSITGLLLFKDGHFMQALEGEDAVVRDLYATIAADSRHTRVRTLYEEQIVQREFPEWTMGLRQVSDGVLRGIPGYDDFFDGHPDASGWATESRSRLILEWFRHHEVA